jgi:hypothetical protein
LEGFAGGLEAGAGFICGEQSLMDGTSAGVVDLVGDAGKVGVDPASLRLLLTSWSRLPRVAVLR